jgi:hypothetical protein
VAISLDAIYQPLNQFFLQKFGTGDGAQVTFRFAHLPQGFVDSDFLPPLSTDQAPSPPIADEQFSTVTDCVPRLDPDGRTVWLSTSRLSDLYHDEILSPAVPFVPADVTEDSERQALVDGFNTVKADAIRDWVNGRAASLLEGPGVDFHPSAAMPRNWWDKTADVWTHQIFQVKGAASVGGPSPQPSDQILRMKVDDSVLRSIILSHAGPATPPQPSPVTPQPTVTLS